MNEAGNLRAHLSCDSIGIFRFVHNGKFVATISVVAINERLSAVLMPEFLHNPIYELKHGLEKFGFYCYIMDKAI
jgi:hypothetical protein